MPSGPKKRRAARKKKELEKNLALELVEKSQELKPKTDVESAEDASAEVNAKATQESPNESARESEVFVSPSDDESSEKSGNNTAKITPNAVDSDPNRSDEKLKPKADVDSEEDAASSVNVEASQENPNESARESEVFVSPAEDESSKKNVNGTAEITRYTVDSDPKRNLKPKTDMKSAEDAPAEVNVKVTQENPDESARECEVFVSLSDDESSKKRVNDTAKMTQNTVDSDPNGTDVNVLPSKGGKTEPAYTNPNITAHPAHDDLKKSEENFLPPLGADKTSESATSTLSDHKANDEISPSLEANLLEIIEDSSDFVLVDDGGDFIPKQDDDAYPSEVVHGVDTADKENEFDIQIQNDRAIFNSQRDASPSFSQEKPEVDDQKEEFLSMKSAISDDEQNQMIPQPLTTNVQINHVKKMLEEALLSHDKLGATLKTLLNDLEAVKNSSDSGFST